MPSEKLTTLSDDLMPNKNKNEAKNYNQKTTYNITSQLAGNGNRNGEINNNIISGKGDNNSVDNGSGSSRRSSDSSLNSFNRNNHHLISSTTSTSSNNSSSSLLWIKLKKYFLFSLFITGLIVSISSLICILLLPTIVSNEISKRLVLKNNSLLLERWSKPNVPMFFKVWVFDVKNAQEVIDVKGTKPLLKEIGPFVFNLKRKKDIVSFSGDNLYYTERKIYHFNKELSCCAINTTVTIPNIPLVAVVDRALSYNLPLVGRFIPRLINRAIQSLREQLFVKKQVGEILFDGYEVELLKMVSRVGSLVGLPQQQQKFALLKGRNDTWRPEQDGVWAINTGIKDRKMFGRVSSWNSYRQLPFWAAPACNTINGSDGTLFPPPIDKTKPLFIFNQELCRTVNLVFDRPSDIHAIKAYRFVLNPMNFAHTMKSSNPLSTSSSIPLTSALNGQRANNNNQRQSPRIIKFDSSVAPKVAGNSQLQSPVSPTRNLSPFINHNQANSNKMMLANLKPSSSETSARILSTSGSTIESAGKPALMPQVSSADADHSMPLIPNNNNNNRQRILLSSNQRKAQANDINRPPTRAEQQRLVQVAQEQQAQIDRQLVSHQNPNTCFCDRKTTNLNGINVCEFDGLIELAKCTKQAQVIFGSMPHFYQSDPRLSKQVIGMEPNSSRHTTYLDIEPNTGLVLGGKRRVQLNIIIKHNNEVEGFENINDMLVPVVWFEESAMIPEETARVFKSAYTDKIRFIRTVIGSLFLVALGVAITAVLASQHGSNCYHRFKLKQSGCSALKAAVVNNNSNSNSDLKKNNPEIAGGGSSMTSSSNKSGHSVMTADDASCLIRQQGGGLTKLMIGKQINNNGAQSPLLANSNNEQQSEGNYLLSPSNQDQGNTNISTNLDQNKSVEFAVHHNDTRYLVEGHPRLQAAMEQQQLESRRSSTNFDNNKSR